MTKQKPPKARKSQTEAAMPEMTVRSAAAIPSFDDLPDSALVRQAQLVRDPKYPARLTPLPFSPATFWRKVKEGAFPKPIKLSERVTAWKVGEVRAWIEAQAAK